MTPAILVIDDEDLIVKSLIKLFAKAGYQTLTSLSGREAVQTIGERHVDLILCDIRMPGQNGIDTIKEISRLRQDQKKEMPPVVFLTGYADPLLESAARELEPLAYLLKPFDAFQLLQLIQTTFGGRSSELKAPRRK